MSHVLIAWVLFALVWMMTFLPAGKLLLLLLAATTQSRYMFRPRFIALFVLYRVVLALPYIILLQMAGSGLGGVIKALAIGIVLLGLVFSVVRFFFAQYVTGLLWNVYGYVYDGLLHFYPYRHLLDLTMERITTSRPVRVLDLGCGTGNLLVQLAAKPNVSVVGADASATMVGVTKHKLRKLQLTAEITQDDAVHFLQKQPDHSFDYIVMVNVLYAVSNRAELWSEVLRVLTPKGQAIITNSDRPGSGAIIQEHLAHDRWWKLFHPKLIAVGVIDALISELSKSQIFSFITRRRLLAETKRAGGTMRKIERCYGGPSKGVNLLFTLTRSNT